MILPGRLGKLLLMGVESTYYRIPSIGEVTLAVGCFYK
jgi:hypothetical protein